MLTKHTMGAFLRTENPTKADSLSIYGAQRMTIYAFWALDLGESFAFREMVPKDPLGCAMQIG